MIKICNRVISKDFDSAKTIGKKALGLMFRFKVSKPMVFYFDYPQKISLHMFFVFMPIDLIFLDKQKNVIELKKDFLPFTFYTSKVKAKYLIEAKQGTINRFKIKLKNKIYF